MGTDAGKVGLMKKSMYGTRDAASNWERGKSTSGTGDFNWDSEESVSPQRGPIVGFDTR